MHELPLQSDTSQQHADNVAALLGIITSQIEVALHESNAPASTLVEAVHSMSGATQIISQCLADFSGSPARVFQDVA
jgi:hypothetical protein